MTREERLARKKAYYEINKERINAARAEKYILNSEAIKAKRKKYYATNKEKVSQTCKTYREANKEKISSAKKQYWQEWYSNQDNRQEYLEKAKVREQRYRPIRTRRNRERARTDIEYRLQRYLRNRLYCALKGGFKNGSAIRDLGCSTDFLKQYIEKQFQTGMTWENWGKGLGKWHIDHIRPLSSFNLMDKKQLAMACHYTNLQPLWGVENLSKGARLDAPGLFVG